MFFFVAVSGSRWTGSLGTDSENPAIGSCCDSSGESPLVSINLGLPLSSTYLMYHQDILDSLISFVNIHQESPEKYSFITTVSVKCLKIEGARKGTSKLRHNSGSENGSH